MRFQSFTKNVMYRPSSMSVQQLFFAVLDRFATHQEPIYVVGDFNVRLDHPDNPHFRLLVYCYWLKLHATGLIHQLGGTSNAVTTQDTTGCPDYVAVEDVGPSNHHLLHCEVSTTRSTSSVANVRTAIWTWSFLDLLCLLRNQTTGIDELAALYDTELISFLDRSYLNASLLAS